MREATMTSPKDTGSTRRPLAFAVLGALVLIALAFAFIAGTRYAPTGPTPQEQAQAHVDVWGTVEIRPVNSALTYSGTAHAGATTPIRITAPTDPVLVHQVKHPGDTVAPGDLIGIVGGEGIYALNGPLPLYRPLTLGDTGHDVLELQRALTDIGYPTNTDGTVTNTTLTAVSNLLRSELTGIPPEGIETINPAHFAILPPGPRTVAQAATTGTIISEETPIITLHTSAPYAEFNAPLRDLETLTALDHLTVTSSLGSTPARIDHIGQVTTGHDGAYQTIRLTPENTDIIVPDQTLAIATAGDTTPVLAVPISAVRQDGTTTYLLTATTEGTQERVPVEVLRTGEGYAAIQGDITEGQKVLLS